MEFGDTRSGICAPGWPRFLAVAPGYRPSGSPNVGLQSLVGNARQHEPVAIRRVASIFRAMPELAEVEFYRKQWNNGLGQKIVAVQLHAGARNYRGTDAKALGESLSGAVLRASEARGKQMLFRFSGGRWLGVHLGMTGQLRTEKAGFAPAKHDHLLLAQARQALVFSDPRQFGRVRFHHGEEAPPWWTKLPPPVTAPEFTVAVMESFLHRHKRLPL